MKTKIITLLFAFCIISCSKDEENSIACFKNNPLEELNWLKEIKKNFENTKDSADKKIVEYTYNEQTVFEVNSCVNCADSMTIIYNCKGEEICKFGGIAGLNTCDDFYKKVTNKKVLWRNYNDVIINKDLYKNVKTDNYTIKNASINGDFLTVTIVSGGCSGNSWIVSLVDSENILESKPPQKELKIELINKELCYAIVTKEFVFDITKLREDGNAVILNIAGWQKKITYNY